MKVKELIEALGTFDPELKVVVDGYEGGYDDLDVPEIVGIKIDPSAEWYDGKYTYVGLGEKSEESAVYIARGD